MPLYLEFMCHLPTSTDSTQFCTRVCDNANFLRIYAEILTGTWIFFCFFFSILMYNCIPGSHFTPFLKFLARTLLTICKDWTMSDNASYIKPTHIRHFEFTSKCSVCPVNLEKAVAWNLPCWLCILPCIRGTSVKHRLNSSEKDNNDYAENFMKASN